MILERVDLPDRQRKSPMLECLVDIPTRPSHCLSIPAIGRLSEVGMRGKDVRTMKPQGGHTVRDRMQHNKNSRSVANWKHPGLGGAGSPLEACFGIVRLSERLPDMTDS